MSDSIYFQFSTQFRNASNGPIGLNSEPNVIEIDDNNSSQQSNGNQQINGDIVDNSGGQQTTNNNNNTDNNNNNKTVEENLAELENNIQEIMGSIKESKRSEELFVAEIEAIMSEAIPTKADTEEQVNRFRAQIQSMFVSDAFPDIQ